jgi:hypothetical protein
MNEKQEEQSEKQEEQNIIESIITNDSTVPSYCIDWTKLLNNQNVMKYIVSILDTIDCRYIYYKYGKDIDWKYIILKYGQNIDWKNVDWEFICSQFGENVLDEQVQKLVIK